MSSAKTILVVDDHAVNRSILSKILSAEYTILQAENGQIAMEQLNVYADEIAAVMLDLVMPVMDGYAVLKGIQNDIRYGNLPIIVTTENSDNDNEIKALTLGAWDFISKPYNPQIICFRLKNAIDRSQLSALKQLKYLAEYDSLTGIYNKAKFFAETYDMIKENRNKQFAFLRFDVDRFQLINSFFGASEGDKLLIYIAKHLEEDVKKFGEVTFGRIESDIFGVCMAYQPNALKYMTRRSKQLLTTYNPNYDIVPSVGIYIIDDNTISVEEMYSRATLAAKLCKGHYVDYYAYYNENMSLALTREQEIINEMNFALENDQFKIYLQPQYNIHTNLPCGAEALVRWIHPEKGVISPGEFIPVFERNGFITKLDYYVWEQACKYLRAWIDQGIKPYPLSVNVSRVNLYNPQLAEMLLGLVERYQIEPALLDLELTESAYTDNPVAMQKTITQLQSYGFTIMMDDFGSGYSSLGLLKDIMIDILKIDMQFLSKTKIPGRGENIVASVIRMAKWLNVPVIAEGAETEEQVSFLRSVGCDYVQGYYFAHPMPIHEYERLCLKQSFDVQMINDKRCDNYHYNDLFSFNQEMKLLFNNALQAAVIYEFMDDQLEIIRVNEAYYALLGHDDMLANASNIFSVVDQEYRMVLMNTFQICVHTKESSECEYMRHRANGTPLWIHTKLNYVSTAGNKHILIGELNDITMRKGIDSEIEKYKASLLFNDRGSPIVLIVDDVEINLTIIERILQGQFLFLEARNNEAAIQILQDRKNQIDLILLDMSMSKMDWKKLLQFKKSVLELDEIPIIMMTADDSPAQQIRTLSLGANDYIVKPFIPEVVTRRVKNVLESNHRFKKMVKEYNNMSEQVKTDLMTGLLNRASAEVLIAQRLESTLGRCAMIMLDIDNFKKINDTRGHAYGDKAISGVADTLRVFFRKSDIIARMGGDEFSVFMENIPEDIEIVRLKAHQLCQRMSHIEFDGKNAEITCSVGIAIVSGQGNSFETLYQNADKALYNAKCHGRNTVSVYGDESEATSITKWITDAESVLDAINDSIYACDRDTYELIYANDNLCQFVGVTQEACRGRKCYDILMHKAAPCEFCSLSKMSENQVYTRLFCIPDTSHVFLMRGKTINHNGSMVHLEVAVDVTKIENMNLYEEMTRYRPNRPHGKADAKDPLPIENDNYYDVSCEGPSLQSMS